MKTQAKKIYVPPTVKVTRVLLEGSIAIQSPIQQVNFEDWSYDEYPSSHESNNRDIWLDI